MIELLLCTDLDRTLIPNGRQSESDGARELFSRLSESKGIQLTYVSGRDQVLIQQAIADYELPTPDFAIADVGSSIYLVKHDKWQRWHEWDNEISQDWHGFSAEDLPSLLEDISLLQLQESAKQGKYKCSYYLPLEADHKAVMAMIKQRFELKKIKANLIWSIDEAAETGLLDILPVSANKLHAILFLQQQRGFSDRQVIFAGDSGNDLDVLLSPLQSVLVANASNDVRLAIQNEGEHLQDSLYIAEGGFLGMNGNYSAGILEGIVHYRPDLLALINGEK